MADIYGRQQQEIGGVFTSDQALLAISGGVNSVAGALVQNVRWEYTQDSQDMYELGSNKVYRVLGRPKGRMTIERVIGAIGTTDFAGVLLAACAGGGTMTLTGRPSDCIANASAITWTFTGVQVVSLGGAASVQDHMIRENLQLVFTSMSK
jgi:hypothetical protein